MMSHNDEAANVGRDDALDSVRAYDSVKAYLAGLSDPSAPPDLSAPPDPSGRAFPQKLLAALAVRDRETFEALVRENPEMEALRQADQTSHTSGERDEKILSAVRRVLRATPAAGESPGFRASVERTKAQLAQRRRAVPIEAEPLPAAPVGEEQAPLRFPGEGSGIFTSMTRQLDPEKAVELYRKITPLLVFSVLKRLDRSTSLDRIHALTEHLCGEAVQARFREAEHVRDAIVDELCIILGDSGIRRDLDRESLLIIMEESGATADLAAMANCVTLSKTRAG